MTRTSNHYRQDRARREEAISRIGEGTVVYSTVVWDVKRKRYFLYEITDNAIITVKATDKDLVITKLIARPSRIRQYWQDCPREIMEKAIAHTRQGLTF